MVRLTSRVYKGGNMIKKRVKPSFMLFFLLISTLFFFSCSGTKPSIFVKKMQRTEDDLRRKEQELQEKTQENLELKNQALIIESEINDLKTTIQELENGQDSLHAELEAMQKTVEELEVKIAELSEKNDIFQNQIKTSQDSLAKILEMAAIEETQKNLMKIMAENQPPQTQHVSDRKYVEQQADQNLNEIGTTLSREEYLQRYQEGLDLLLTEKKPYQAIEKFNDLLNISTNNAYADNCQYWIGEAYYSVGNYHQAIEAFKKVETLPDGNKADHAYYKIGLSYLKLGQKEKSLEVFQSFLEKYPRSELVENVQEMIRSNQF